eukprot:TRINITY_DN1061_c0_g2_i1.p1 TRINITY_DN1061_c0_g2~~TRINITY_DN1061_c0_g2_i1.p1  ORF type:complete len:118 (-),score=35.56 TRINITY_DN1061_c0_g2_i1:131-484(-)
MDTEKQPELDIDLDKMKERITPSLVSTGSSPSLTVATPDEPVVRKKKKTKKATRCGADGCRKRLELTDLTCRCNITFCGLHCGASDHNCSFDYRAKASAELEKQNGYRAAPSKVIKI